MNNVTLQNRNQEFAQGFAQGDLPILPKLRTVILTCADARVDPAHVLGVGLGDAVVIRNTGGRVTRAVIDEIATLAFMVANMEGGEPQPFELFIMHHTHCAAERMANPEFQQALQAHIGVDATDLAITDQTTSLYDDISRLRSAETVPGYIIASGYIYDVKTGALQEVVKPAALQSTPAALG